jgi:hypothetical protein
MFTPTHEDLLCLLELLTDAIERYDDGLDEFDCEADYKHAQDLLRRVKEELAVPHA